MKKKLCWMAKRYKIGWKIGLCIGNQDTRWVQGVYFKSEKDVETAIKSNIVFVHMAGDGK